MTRWGDTIDFWAYVETTAVQLYLKRAAAFRYNDKTYRFVINGRNGKTQGERPYSIIKIVFTALLVSSLVAGTVYYLDKAGFFADIQTQSSGSYYQPKTYQKQYPTYPSGGNYRYTPSHNNPYRW